MPRRQGQVLVLVGVVDGSLDVDDDGVVACSSGSSVSLGDWSGLTRVGVLPVILAGMWMEMTVNTE